MLAYSTKLAYCGILCPGLPATLALMRLGRDGAERWSHVQTHWQRPFVGLNHDGSAITAALTGTVTLGEIQRIDANGAAAPR